MSDWIPPAIAALPFDETRRAPIPWFVYRPDGWHPGDPIDFRIADGDKRALAFKRDLCWVCGTKLGLTRCCAIGPMSLITRTSSEPQLHPGCAEWSVCNCPFLARPQMRRSPREKPEGAVAAGMAIERNPGVVCVGYTRRKLEVLPTPTGPIFRIPDRFLRLVFKREGRDATYNEVLASITTGLPILIGHEPTHEGRAALGQEVDRTLDLVERYFNASTRAALYGGPLS